MKHLHDRDICHRDLKPENIMFTSRSGFNLKVIDFGLSKLKAHQMTTRIGTPYYVSPEVLSGERPYTKECDLWSLGVILYFIVVGYPPFHGTNEASLFRKILNGVFEFPKISDISEEVKDLIT